MDRRTTLNITFKGFHQKASILRPHPSLTNNEEKLSVLTCRRQEVGEDVVSRATTVGVRRVDHVGDSAWWCDCSPPGLRSPPRTSRLVSIRHFQE